MKLKKVFIKLISVLLVLIYTIPISTIANSNNTTEWPRFNADITSKAAIVMDADSSKILYEFNSTQKLYPASLVKLMTALIVLEKANGSYDDLVTFSYNAITKDIDRKSVTIGASAGDQLTLKDCLYCLMLPSANDVANALAEYTAGSINDFVALMNERAETLGLKNTHFVNPSGLHDDDQYTTAYDMAIILKTVMAYPMFMQISPSVSYRHAPIKKFKNPDNSNNLVLNTNSIVIPGNRHYYNKTTSGKTGHTALAGYNLAASARENDMNLICVVLGSKTDSIRFEESKNLFDFHFDNYKSIRIKDADPRFSDPLSMLSINDVNLVETLNISCSDNAHITLPKNANIKDVRSVLSFQVRDIYNKYAIGYIDYYLDDEPVGSCTLEGRNIDKLETIYLNFLNLSNSLSQTYDNNDGITNDTNSLANPNALISRDTNGNLLASNTLITLFVIIGSLVLLIVIFAFIYLNILQNPNIPFNKIAFKLTHRFKR